MDFNNIVLYSTGCPKCIILENKLNDKKIKYEKEKDTDKMLQLGITTVPALKVNGKILSFADAIMWVNHYEN